MEQRRFVLRFTDKGKPRIRQFWAEGIVGPSVGEKAQQWWNKISDNGQNTNIKFVVLEEITKVDWQPE